MKRHNTRWFLAAALSLCSAVAWGQETDIKNVTIQESGGQLSDDKKPEEKKKRDQFRINSTGGGGLGGGARDGKTFPERLIGPLGKDLNAYGNWVLTLRSNQVSGSDSAKQWFNFQNNNQFFNTTSLGPFQQQLDLTLMGSVFNALRVNTSLTNNRVAAQTSLAQLLGFEFESADKRTKAAFGDVNANLPGNELVTFSRRLVGVQYDRQLGGGRVLSTVASITRALARRGSFQGNGTTGPYYLNASQIIPGSEKLFLNGQQLTPYEDYELDYILGTVRMKKSRILNREDTIEFTYEAQNFNTAPGVLTGMRYEMPTEYAKNARMGVTLLRQTAGSSGTANRPVTQYFPVSADLASRYTLPSPIKSNTPVEVRYQERLLTEGINADYILNRDLNFIQLRRSLPADTALLGISSLSVTYTPVPQSGVGGDKQVIGFDTQFTPTAGSRVNLQYGQSQGISKLNSGSGLILNASFGQNDEGTRQTGSQTGMFGDKDRPATPAAERFQSRWRGSVGIRNIEPGFSSIESTAAALLRSEKGIRGSFAFTPTEALAYDFSFNNSTISQPASTSTTTTTTTTATAYKNQSFNVGANWTPTNIGKRKLPKVRFAHAGTNQGSGTSAATFTSDTLSASYDIHKGSVEASLSRTGSNGRSIFAYGYTSTVGTGTNSTSGGLLGGYRDGTSAATTTNSASDNASLRFNMTPSTKLSFSSTIGITSNRSGGGTFRGKDLAFSTTYSPIADKLQIQLDLTDTANGQSLNGFFNTGSGLDTTGNTLGGSSTGQRTRSRNARVSYSPIQRLRIEGGYIQQLSLIPGYDNTQSSTTDVSMDYGVSDKIKLLGQWSQQATAYVGSTGNSDNSNYLIQATMGPFKRANFTLSGAHMGFGSAFSSTSGSIGGGLGTGFGSGTSTTGFGQQGITDTLVLRTTYSVTLSQRRKGAGTAPPKETPFLPFMEWRLLNSRSPDVVDSTTTNTTNTTGVHNALNYLNSEVRFGTEWGLSSLLSASLDIRFTQVTDRDAPNFSYRARTLNFDIRARFN